MISSFFRAACAVLCVLCIPHVSFSVAQAAQTDVVINEIMYKPADDADSKDWVELFNRGNDAVDLSGWRLRDDDDSRAYEFPDGTELGAGAYLLVAQDVEAFAIVYPGVSPVIGGYEFGFGSNADAVRIFDRDDRIIDMVAYSSESPWPAEANSGGLSLALVDPALDNALASNWLVTAEEGGSPGAANEVEIVLSSIVINEIMYRADPDPLCHTEDWVELYNKGSEALDLSGWQFMDDNDQNVFVIPDGTIMAPDSYLIIAEDPELFGLVHPQVPRVLGPLDFGLGSNGDAVRILDDESKLQDRVYYDVAAPWPAGANGEGASIELSDPSLDNALASSWRASGSKGGTPGASNRLAASLADGGVPGLDLHNFPNPARQFTTLGFNLRLAASVRPTLIGVNGQLIRSLPERMLDAGQHSISIDLIDLPTGTYVCALAIRQNGSWRMAGSKLITVVR